MLAEYKAFFNNLDKLESLVNNLKSKIRWSHHNGGKIIFLGNGGSLSTCLHMAHDFHKVGQIRTSTLSSPTHITCLFNDCKDDCFVEYLKIEADPKDCLVLISSSGESANVVNAAKYARTVPLWTCSITGFNVNNKLNKETDWPIWLDTKSYGCHEIGSEVLLHSILDDLVKEKNG